MAKYPSSKEIRDGLADGELDQLLTDMPDYHRTPRPICELHHSEVKITPDLLHAWAYLAEALAEHMPTAEIDGFKIARPLTADELEAAAIAWKSGKVYQERIEAEKAAEADAEGHKAPF